MSYALHYKAGTSSGSPQQIVPGGSVQQEFTANMPYVDQFGAVVGWNPESAVRDSFLIELQLLDDRGAVLERSTQEVNNNRETVVTARPPVPVEVGETYALRVVNRSDDVLGIYVNDRVPSDASPHRR